MGSLHNDDVLLPRTGRKQEKDTHEYCKGYLDKNAIWNNGFYCPRWGGPDDVYCCENGSEKFCCPEPGLSTRPSPVISTEPHTSISTTIRPIAENSVSSTDYIPFILGAAGGLLVLVLVLLLLCIFCSCCPIYKARHRKSKRPVVLTRTISVNLEGEATSSIIASQAMSSMTSNSTQRSSGTNSSYLPPQTSPCLLEEEHLHCGCRWSPRESRNTVEDLDNIVANMYQNAALPWQTELDNLYNCYTCSDEQGPQCDTVRSTRGYGPEGQTILEEDDRGMISKTSHYMGGVTVPIGRFPLTYEGISLLQNLNSGPSSSVSSPQTIKSFPISSSRLPLLPLPHLSSCSLGGSPFQCSGQPSQHRTSIENEDIQAEPWKVQKTNNGVSVKDSELIEHSFS